MQHPAIVLCAGYQQDQSLDVTVELLAVLAAQELLQVADARFRDDPHAHAPNLHEHDPRPLVVWPNRRLEPTPDRLVERREKSPDERDMRRVPQAARRRKELDPHLESNDPSDARCLHESGMRRSARFVPTDCSLRDAGGRGHERLAQTSSKACVAHLIPKSRTSHWPRAVPIARSRSLVGTRQSSA